jgi:two-component system sensor histidine kinase CpxA
MRNLVITIFLCYWVGATAVLLIMDRNVHVRMHHPQAKAALGSALALQADNTIHAYETSGCAVIQQPTSIPQDHVYLALADGTVLCGSAPASGMRSLVAEAVRSRVPEAKGFGAFQVVAQAGASPSGKIYVMLLKSAYLTPFSAFGFISSTTTFAISIVVTLLLAILITIPLKRLRSATCEIANGRLDTRVKLAGFYRWLPRLGGEDAIVGLAADFNHMADQLESLADAQRVLFRDISHELRSPLARLSVALELAREAGKPSMKAPLDRIEEEAARVNDLIGQLLSLAHMESLRELTEPANLSLSDLVESIMPDMEYEAVGRRCHVVARTSEDCLILGDPVMLQRAFENVVRNAIRYTPEDGIVEIDVERRERDGASFGVLRIGDNGPGVPSEELQSILRPFYRADKSRQRSTGGFGVGLAIANRAVNLHGGEIVVCNRPEGGLVVEMSFPLTANVLHLAEVSVS